MTPSGWHQDASGRDAGHDEMQAGVFRFMKHKEHTLPLDPGNGKVAVYKRVGIYFECPFFLAGRISTFVDVCLHFQSTEADGYRQRDEALVCYEIKPRIYSVGAVVRQCHATAHAVEQGSVHGGYVNPGFRKKPRVLVIPVVPADDPKVRLLAEFWWEVMLWDAATSSCIPYEP